MKKEYVKPTLSAEMFVANEYVAACYYKVYCLGYTKTPSGDFVNNNDKHSHKEGKLEIATVKGTPSFDTKTIQYSPLGLGIIGNKKDYVDSYTVGSTQHYSVSAESYDIPGHPNASI